MNKVKKIGVDVSAAPNVYAPGLVGKHIQGDFYVIFMENSRWMNLASGESYAADAPIKLLSLGDVIAITVG